MSSTQERRRESRIHANATTFTFAGANGSLLRCEVVNLSRLGLGVELPAGAPAEQVEGLRPGTRVEGTLLFAGDSLAATVDVRVRKDRFVGLEYAESAAVFISRLRTLLTPQYVASSMHTIASEFLAADIRAAYQADDFECIIFKPGVSGVKSMVQIYWSGKVVEVVDDVARFVPPLLMRGGGGSAGTELFRSFSGLNDEGNEREMADFFRSLAKVFAVWPTCPLELQGMLKKQLAARA
jgi:hypothetical protein